MGECQVGVVGTGCWRGGNWVRSFRWCYPQAQGSARSGDMGTQISVNTGEIFHATCQFKRHLKAQRGGVALAFRAAVCDFKERKMKGMGGYEILCATGTVGKLTHRRPQPQPAILQQATIQKLPILTDPTPMNLNNSLKGKTHSKSTKHTRRRS